MSNRVIDSVAAPTEPAKLKTQPVRRTSPDRSQRIRLIVQGLFILLNVFLATQF